MWAAWNRSLSSPIITRGNAMARKYDFQPDKPRSTWLSKLYLTKLQRQALLKWFLYGLSLLVLSLLQDVILCRFRINGATTELVPCGIFLICILEGTEKGSVFALVSSVLYLFSGTAAGPHAVALITLLAIVVCSLRQGYLQKSFSSAMLCQILAMVLYEGMIFAVALFLGVTYPERYIGFVITTGLTLAVAPVLYPIFVAIGSIGGESWKE